MTKERIDVLLVQRGLAASRERAGALILAGKVVCNDNLIEKAGIRVESSAEIRLKGEDIPFVGRGGLKLEAALKVFQVDVNNRVAIDIGPPPEVLVIACSSAEPCGSMLWMSVMDNSPGHCATTIVLL